MVPGDDLRNRARSLIEAGTLPGRRPDRTWGGRGSGDRCPVCGARVTKEEIEMEIEFARTGEPGPATFHVHLDCFAALEQERRQREDAAATMTSRKARRTASQGLNGHRDLNGS